MHYACTLALPMGESRAAANGMSPLKRLFYDAMIAALTGELVRVLERSVLLQAGPIQYELLVPAADLGDLHGQIGREVTFHTIFYFEGDASRGGLEPRLIGFQRPDDRGFFEKFTTVKGIGPKTALRALSVPAGQIAAAIESRNARFLTQLDGIGKRTAELIIAELAGKLGRYATVTATAGEAPAMAIVGNLSDTEKDAIDAMVQLGERRPDAERLFDRARRANPAAQSSEALLAEMLRLRTARS